MSGSNLVIVESPAKAKTINKYLGTDFDVVASYGHIRDLPAKDGSVLPDDDFSMIWEPGERSRKHIDVILKAAKTADTVYLATDPDREGEAISWHVCEVMRQKKLLDRVTVLRVTFNEITKSAVQDAFNQPRDVDRSLVEAYLARRALDYLVGFTLSPVLWRKLPGARSAGRVQSVALRLICEREAEIERFRPQEYWSIEIDFVTERGDPFTARLTQLDGKKLDRFAIGNKDDALAIAKRLGSLDYRVGKVERKRVKRHPAAPFTTSTLQQEASRKLGFGATRTMRTAQKLYEGVDIGGETVGLITYMRTDGTSLSNDAIAAARDLIDKTYGANYVPAKPRIYKSTAKNAQEAHEAVRPTDLFRRPQDVAAFLGADEKRLYELIWKRTVACEMQSAELDQVGVDIVGDGVVLRATGSIIAFDGFLKVYQEDKDDPSDDDDNARRLPALAEGESVERKAVKPEQHFTQPPPRYTEASLVKKMEELGIGRPSTYASIIQVLQDRDYVVLDKRRFTPADRGRLVTAFLESFFDQYVEYSFTADLEDKLDAISAGRVDWKEVLRDFWSAFSERVDETKGLSISQVIDALDEVLGPHFFPDDGTGTDPRLCPTCNEGRLSLKLGKFGAFIGCSNYPDCRHTSPLAVATKTDGDEDGKADELLAGPLVLGNDPETGREVSIRRGPYGLYVQLDAAAEKEKPKRVSLPKNLSVSDVDLDRGLKLLSLPRLIGRHPDSGDDILAGIGRYGPYLKLGSAYKTLGPDDDVLEIGINRAVTVLAEGGGKRPAATILREIGAHPANGEPITLNRGRYGPYVKHGKVMASISKSDDVDTLSLERAIELLDAKANAKGKGKTTKAKATTSKAKKTKQTDDTSASTAAAKTSTRAKKPAASDSAKAEPATTKTTTAKSKTAKTKASTGTRKKAGARATKTSTTADPEAGKTDT